VPGELNINQQLYDVGTVPPAALNPDTEVVQLSPELAVHVRVPDIGQDGLDAQPGSMYWNVIWDATKSGIPVYQNWLSVVSVVLVLARLTTSITLAVAVG
jgi:hypothetical protein